MKTRKYSYLFVLLLAVWAFAACTATPAAPTEAIEEPAAPTETAAPPPTETIPTATELPVPTAIPTEEPTAVEIAYPPAQVYHQLVYDPTSNSTILLSGSTGGYIQPKEDIWMYKTETNEWSLIGSIKSDFPRGVYVPDLDQVVIYSAVRVISANSGTTAKKLYTLDVNTMTLERIEDETMPVGYAFSPLVYDAESKKVILFGGWILDEDNAYHNETFAYDPALNSWEQMNPEIMPKERSDHMMVYHPTMDRVILLGGEFDWSEPEYGTWSYDYNTDSWSLLEEETKPPDRLLSAMVYVDSTDQIFLFGGISGGVGLNDMWVYDHAANTWTALTPNGDAPGGRGYHALAYDPVADKVILFGGGLTYNPGEFGNETWVYDPQTNAWTDMTPGH
jgi:N-acetylneuraminic acid mutarotase